MRARWLPLALIATITPALASAAPQKLDAPPTFRAGTDVVQVDVVVRDRKGKPVTSLRREDFTVLEDGVPQPIDSFDVVDGPELEPSPAVSAAPLPAAPEHPSVTSNSRPDERIGRTIVVVFDDVHLSPLSGQLAKSALKAFIERVARDGDAVALASSTGSYWTTRLPAGRVDLLTVLRGLEGRRIPSLTMDAITDYEAMQVHLHNDTAVGDRLARRFRSYQIDFNTQNMSLLKDEERLRVFPGINEPMVEMRAAERYTEARRRNQLTLGAMQRALDAVAAAPGRKSVILVSEGFVFDSSLEEHREVIEASRRANAAVYFVDARGLSGLPGFMTAEFGRPVDHRDYGMTLANTELDAEGAAAIAESTGGFVVRSSNDLLGGIERVAADSRSYYVLGYTPKESARDGRFHSIRVKVARKYVTVRARKGYYAARDGEPKRRLVDGLEAELQDALASPTAASGIPLRAGAYVFGPKLPGQSQVKIAIEIDITALEFAPVADGKLQNTLELVCVVASPGSGTALRQQKTLQVTLTPQALGAYRESWYPFDQEFDLGPGPHQVRVLVRDAKRRVGTLIHDFDVPPVDTLRVSTPVLTDVIEVNAEDRQVAAVPVARRTFDAGKPLYLQFEVLGAAGGLAEEPEVTAGYQIRTKDGTVARNSSPKRISPTSIGNLSRLVQIPPNALPPADYELVLEVRDELGRQNRTVSDSFTLVSSR